MCVNFLKSQLDNLYSYFSRRVNVKKDTEEEKIKFVKNMFAVCESGWDSSPCCDAPNELFAMDRYVQIALNSLIYDVECKISAIYMLLGDEEKAMEFSILSQNRKKLINLYMLNSDGIFNDYNFKDKVFSDVISTASFYPYAVGLATDKQGLKKLLKLLELPYGISTCEFKQKDVY